ncbi:hypothetical protein [Cohnella nanjingensis]|uniref:Hydrolase n=1 Tax=Cohnella nanjingensis TaxID=1387779 RepID=A0A7X0RXU2_9BACL|nr:hypothetical protein [Cohnella nanjingensis]MBB6675560.1 hypothetical protein [Cohnella nanjingensis]
MDRSSDKPTDSHADNQTDKQDEKQVYYVSVSAGTVSRHESQVSDQLTVFATEREKDQLETLLAIKEDQTERTFLRGLIPFKSADRDPATDQYNERMIEVYRSIFRLGTEETRRHLIHMDILNFLKDPDTRLPGYH